MKVKPVQLDIPSQQLPCVPLLTAFNKLLSGQQLRPFSKEESNVKTTGTDIVMAATTFDRGASQHQGTNYNETKITDSTRVSSHNSSNKSTFPDNGKPDTGTKNALVDSCSNIEFRDPILDTL